MADTVWKSKEIQLAKCITDGLSEQTWQGPLQTVATADESFENAIPVFSDRYIRDNQDYKDKLTVYVSLANETLDFVSQRCLEKRYEVFICIGRQFKGCEELDCLLFLKEQIQDWICGHCCEGFNFTSFSDERLITYDSDLMTNGIFETFIPLEYQLVGKQNIAPTEGIS